MGMHAKTVYIECEGDYCGSCLYCVHTDAEPDRALCMIYRARSDEHPRLLQKKPVDLGHIPAYITPLQGAEKVPEAVRCAPCLAEFPSTGIFRRKPRGMMLYPSPEQMVRGSWLVTDQIVDLAQVMPGYQIQVKYGYVPEGDDSDDEKYFDSEIDASEGVLICALTVSIKKGARGPITWLGGSEGWQNLERLPKGAAEALFQWVGYTYNHLVDVSGSVTDQLWESLHGES